MQTTTIFFIILFAIQIFAIYKLFAIEKKISGPEGKIIKRANKLDKILEFIKQNKQAGNNDIEKLLKVSDATATRYLDELEKQGKIEQIGAGRSIQYRLK